MASLFNFFSSPEPLKDYFNAVLGKLFVSHSVGRGIFVFSFFPLRSVEWMSLAFGIILRVSFRRWPFVFSGFLFPPTALFSMVCLMLHAACLLLISFRLINQREADTLL